MECVTWRLNQNTYSKIDLQWTFEYVATYVLHVNQQSASRFDVKLTQRKLDILTHLAMQCWPLWAR